MRRREEQSVERLESNRLMYESRLLPVAEVNIITSQPLLIHNSTPVNISAVHGDQKNTLTHVSHQREKTNLCNSVQCNS